MPCRQSGLRGADSAIRNSARRYSRSRSATAVGPQPPGCRRLDGIGMRLVVVEFALVDSVDVEAERSGDLVEELGVGEEPLPAGAPADGAAVVGGV